MWKGFKPEVTMPWTGHLEELRLRMIRAALSLVLGTVPGWYLAPRFLAWLRRPVGQLVFVAPAEAFMAHVQIALVLGVLFASPWIVGETVLFVWPGLLAHEKTVAKWALPMAYLLFLLGGVLGYHLLFPMGVQAMLQLASGPVTPVISVAKYLGLFWSTVLPCAMAMELPLIVVVAVVINAIDLQWLRSQRGMALLLSFIVGGMISSHGVLVQALLAVPLFLLFEFGLFLSGLVKVPLRHENPVQ